MNAEICTKNVSMGYGYHPRTTGAYLQRALEQIADVSYVGTPQPGVPGCGATDDVSIIMAEAESTPDLYLYVDSGDAYYFPRGLTALLCPTACYLIDVHIHPVASLQRAMFFDYAFSAQRDFVSDLKNAGHPHAQWLPLACDPATHYREPSNKIFDVGFVGSTAHGYERRLRLLELLAARYTVNNTRATYSPAHMADVYAQSRIVFNCSLLGEVNMRVFEGAASGTLLLTDRIDNGLSDLMTDGVDMMTYTDETLLQLIAAVLGDDDKRTRIAAQGSERVIAEHTYAKRAESLLRNVFDADCGPPIAPLRTASKAHIAMAYAAQYSRAARIRDTVSTVRPYVRPTSIGARASREIVRSIVRTLQSG